MLKTLKEVYNIALGSFGKDYEHIRDEQSGIDLYFSQKDGIDQIVLYGSDEKNDWITNFTFGFKKWKRPDYAKEDTKIRVHSGYFDGWYRIREKVLGKITSDKILVTGYSMGGGLSSIIAVDIQYNKNPKELLCVDFDGAKVWNKAGRNSFNKRVSNSFRIINGNDIVTKIPPFYYAAGVHQIHIGKRKRWWKLSIKDHLELFEDRDNIRKQLEQL